MFDDIPDEHPHGPLSREASQRWLLDTFAHHNLTEKESVVRNARAAMERQGGINHG